MKVVIEIEDGIVTSVSAEDSNIECHIIDYDLGSHEIHNWPETQWSEKEFDNAIKRVEEMPEW